MYTKLFWVLTDINVAYILYFFFTKDRKLIKNLIPLHLCKMISYVCLHCCFSGIQLFVTLWTIASVAPLSVGFSRQVCWTGLPCSPPGDLPNSEIQPGISYVSCIGRQILYQSSVHKTEEAEGLRSMESPRVGQDWATFTSRLYH